MQTVGQTSESENSPSRLLRGSPAPVSSTRYHGWENPTEPTEFKNSLASKQQILGGVPSEPTMLPRSDMARFVNAEVAAVNEEGILFNCHLQSREVTIQLPKALISEHLQKLGQPVTISFSAQNGIRTPSIVERNVEPTRDAFDAEFRAWLDKR